MQPAVWMGGPRSVSPRLTCSVQVDMPGVHCSSGKSPGSADRSTGKTLDRSRGATLVSAGCNINVYTYLYTYKYTYTFIIYIYVYIYIDR